MRIRWTEPSEKDLREIQDWIRRENPKAAQSVAKRILGVADLIASHPSIGKPGRVSGTREMVIDGTPFLIVYAVVEKDVLAIFRVLHGARKWPKSSL